MLVPQGITETPQAAPCSHFCCVQMKVKELCLSLQPSLPADATSPEAAASRDPTLSSFLSWCSCKANRPKSPCVCVCRGLRSSNCSPALQEVTSGGAEDYPAVCPWEVVIVGN